MSARQQGSRSPSITVVDGGMGKELARIGAPFRQPEWSAAALLDDPESVAAAHRNFVDAGAQVIIANTYGVVPFHIGEERFRTRGRELADLAGQLARRVADAADRPVLVAASLPPVFGSYAPELFDADVAPAMLQTLIEAQAPWVDLWIVETIGSVAEAEAALDALDLAGVDGARWLAFSLADETAGVTPTAAPMLWSGESVADAGRVALAAAVDAVLLNCAMPEAVTAALPELVARVRADDRPGPEVGAYANGFPPKPEIYAPNSVILNRREDLTPTAYADHVDRWIELGATIVGGCCGIHPDHIAELSRRHLSIDPEPRSSTIGG